MELTDFQLWIVFYLAHKLDSILGKIKEEAAKVNPGLPVDVIDMKDYGMMNGEKVYNYAKKLMDE